MEITQLVDVAVREKRGRVQDVEVMDSSIAAEMGENHPCRHQ